MLSKDVLLGRRHQVTANDISQWRLEDTRKKAESSSAGQPGSYELPIAIGGTEIPPSP